MEESKHAALGGTGEGPPAGAGAGAGEAISASATAGMGADAAAGETPEEDPPFDLDAYAAKYAGNGRFIRLQFIMQHAPGVRRDALYLLLDSIKAGGWNTALYKAIIDSAAEGELDDAHALDADWVAMVDKKAEQTHGVLERDLSTHHNNMVKESIRRGYNDLAKYHEQRGDLTAAAKCYSRTRDYCSGHRHTMDMCLNSARLYLLTGTYTTLHSFLSRAESLPDMSDAGLASCVYVATGLHHLHVHDYKNAARSFLKVTEAIASNPAGFGEIVHADDIGVLGGLTALATFERADLRDRVLSSPTFKPFLELAPRVRELLSAFVESRYAAALELLDELRPALLLDVYLREHVERLYKLVREAAMLQYFSPYSKVSMVTMADAFRTTVPALETELAALIMSGRLVARIDSHRKVLQSRHANEREATYARALEVGEGFLRDMQAMLLRTNLDKRRFSITHGGGHGGSSRLPRGGSHFRGIDADPMLGGDDGMTSAMIFDASAAGAGAGAGAGPAGADGMSGVGAGDASDVMMPGGTGEA